VKILAPSTSAPTSASKLTGSAIFVDEKQRMPNARGPITANNPKPLPNFQHIPASVAAPKAAGAYVRETACRRADSKTLMLVIGG
jgi:hypothetical protein